MPRIILSLLALIVSITVKSERILQTVRDPANPQQQNAVLGGKIRIAGNSDIYMLTYDDVSFTQTNYPIVGGVQMRFDTYNNPLVHYNLALFFSLSTTVGSPTSRWVYRYNGSSFTRITHPGNVIGNCIVYGSYLYFMSNVSGTVRLYRYNGSVVTEVTGASIPLSRGYQLFVAEGFLYMTGSSNYTGEVNFIRRYNGTSFLTLPWSTSGTNVQNVYGVPGTNRVYFTSHERILYYNGSSVSQVFFNTGESVIARMWRNNLYFTTGVGHEPGRINRFYRLSGSTLTLMSLPAGYTLLNAPSTNPEIYRDTLYISAAHSSGTKHVLKYDGTAYTSFYTLPATPVIREIALYLREGDLMIHPNYVNGNRVIEVDASKLDTIIAPPGRLIFPYINSTACNHLWLNYYSDGAGIHFTYAKESKGCPPPGGGAVPVIPDHFANYERFEMTTWGTLRGWCWSEIIIDWEIVPICQLPPCPLPGYAVRLMDGNNAAWSAQFNQPSYFQVPLPDQQPFRAILSSTDVQKDLLVFEPDLLPMGIETIKVEFKPKQKFFMLTASTRNNSQVPLRATLYNSNGKVLWEQSFTAPLSQQITATVQEPGVRLVFSVPGLQRELITQAQPCPQDVLAQWVMGIMN